MFQYTRPHRMAQRQQLRVATRAMLLTAPRSVLGTRGSNRSPPDLSSNTSTNVCSNIYKNPDTFFLLLCVTTFKTISYTVFPLCVTPFTTILMRFFFLFCMPIYNNHDFFTLCNNVYNTPDTFVFSVYTYIYNNPDTFLFSLHAGHLCCAVYLNYRIEGFPLSYLSLIIVVLGTYQME